MYIGNRLVDFINRLIDVGINAYFIQDTNTLELESEDNHMVIEVYHIIENRKIEQLELECFDELEIIMNEKTIKDISMETFYEMFIMEYHENNIKEFKDINELYKWVSEELTKDDIFYALTDSEKKRVLLERTNAVEENHNTFVVNTN